MKHIALITALLLPFSAQALSVERFLQKSQNGQSGYIIGVAHGITAAQWMYEEISPNAPRLYCGKLDKSWMPIFDRLLKQARLNEPVSVYVYDALVEAYPCN